MKNFCKYEPVTGFETAQDGGALYGNDSYRNSVMDTYWGYDLFRLMDRLQILACHCSEKDLGYLTKNKH